MTDDVPGDDELPPDPFPGDPFAEAAGRLGADGGPAGPEGPGGPFAGLGALGALMGEMARMASSQGPISWDAARQVAVWSASGGAAEPNPDPVERIRLEELCRAAEPHVAEATGLAVSTRRIEVVALTRAQWAAQSLDDLRPILGALASAMQPVPDSTDDPGAAQLAGLLSMISPMLLGLQIGSLLGELAHTALGTYDLPLPRPASDRIGFVPANLAAFAQEWSIPTETAWMDRMVRELVTHAVLRVPHVRERLQALLVRFASSFRIDPDTLGDRLGGLMGMPGMGMAGMGDPDAMRAALGDAESLLGAVESPEQRAARAEIDLLVGPLTGYVEHVAAMVGARLLGDNRMVVEAARRRQIEAGEGERIAAGMLGITLDRQRTDRSSAFIGGVVQRAGSDGLAALWSAPENLPTASELEAPGLWLARLGLLD